MTTLKDVPGTRPALFAALLRNNKFRMIGLLPSLEREVLHQVQDGKVATAV